MDNTEYNYEAAGFNRYMSRNMTSDWSAAPTQSRNLNFDQQQISGALGSILTVGNITIDGIQGALKFYDEDGNLIGIAGKYNA